VTELGTGDGLYEALRSGDEQRLREQIGPLRVTLLRLAKRRIMEDLAEEAVQETLSTLWEKRDSLRGPPHVIPFTFQVLRNKIGNLIRRSRRRGETGLETPQLHRDLESPNPHRIMEGKELAAIVGKAIDVCVRRSEANGLVLRLLWQGRSREEIRAEMGDISLSTQLTRIQRGRILLRQVLAEEFGVDPAGRPIEDS